MLEPSAPLAKTKTPPKRFCSSTETFSLDGLRAAFGFSEAFKKNPNNKRKKKQTPNKNIIHKPVSTTNSIKDRDLNYKYFMAFIGV
ncbi:hypothetical protein oki1423_00700 [Helicobacter pylori]